MMLGTRTPTPPITHEPDAMDAEDILLAGLTHFTAQKVRTAIRNAIDVGRCRDEAMARHDRDQNAFDAMDPCEHVGLTQPFGCSYCGASLNLDNQERHLGRLDQLLERRYGTGGC